MKALRLVLLSLSLLGLLTVLVGCGGSSGAPIFLNIYQRASWEQVTNGRITMTAYGGNGLLYVYAIASTGGNPVLLTPSLNNIYDLMEGGEHPVFAPPASLTTPSTTICMASRRAIAGNSGASLALYTMSSTTGDTTNLVRITNDTSIGADTEPNYRPDGKVIIYSSTRGSSSTQGQLWTANADGSGNLQPVFSAPTGFDDEWPCYNPQNPNQIVFQRAASNAVGVPAQICIYNLSTKTVTNITPPSLSTYANGAPSWSPSGTTIAFHSNPGGNYNIFTMPATGGTPTNVTNDSRSDGFPVWDPTSLYLAFTRDRELWTTTVDGLTQLQLTRRF